MGILLTATFGTRREAEMTIERLVQEFDVERTDISITTETADNSAGEERAGSDNSSSRPGDDHRDDTALEGAIIVTADVAEEEAAEKVRSAFGEFDAEGVVETDTTS